MKTRLNDDTYKWSTFEKIAWSQKKEIGFPIPWKRFIAIIH